MSEKEETARCPCDNKAAGAMAAASLAKYFKEKRWKIISFFPNAKCAGKAVKTPRRGGKKSKKNISKQSRV